MDTKQLADKVNTVFTDAFGRTPLRQRLDDIFKETVELSRYSDLRNMKEEAGDLMCSLLQLFNENGWDAEHCVEETLRKIEKRIQQYKSLGRKSYIGLIGGSFNPCTIGHVKVAKFVLDSSKTFDEVWLLPNFTSITGKHLENATHRLEMCKLACADDGRIKVFDYEITNQLAGQTYHFVKRLLDDPQYRNKYDFSLIIGQDCANSFDKWVEYELLEKMIRFIVVPRKGTNFDPKVTWYLKEPHIYLCQENPVPQISSTEIRQWIKDNDELKLIRNLNHKVLKYIQENKLYL